MISDGPKSRGISEFRFPTGTKRNNDGFREMKLDNIYKKQIYNRYILEDSDIVTVSDI